MIKGSWADIIENKYNTEQRCEKLFLSHLWPDGIKCPKCGCFNPITNKIHANKQKTFVEFKCAKCHKKITEKIDCIFTRSQLSFRDWLKAIYRIAIKNNSTSSCQMCEEIGVEQDTAWFLFIRISQLASDEKITLNGDVEIDGWYPNGNPAYKHNYQHSIYGSDKGKIGESIPIMGMVERAIKYTDENGKEVIIKPAKIVAKSLPHLRGNRSVATKHISELRDQYIPDYENVNVYTDDLGIYDSEDLFKHHKSIKHNVKKDDKDDKTKDKKNNEKIEHYKKYVDDEIYTNNVEGLFSRLSYFWPTHRVITRKHVQKYLDMLNFRENNRHLTTEEKIHKYLSNLPRFPHKLREELVTKEPTGRISKELRIFAKIHDTIVPSLENAPIEDVKTRNDYLEKTKKRFMRMMGPDSIFIGDHNKAASILKKVTNISAPSVTDEEFVEFFIQEYQNLPWERNYTDIKKHLEHRIDLGQMVYDNKNIPGEAELFKQRQIWRRYNKKQKLKKQENAENSDKNTSKKSKEKS